MPWQLFCCVFVVFLWWFFLRGTALRCKSAHHASVTQCVTRTCAVCAPPDVLLSFLLCFFDQKKVVVFFFSFCCMCPFLCRSYVISGIAPLFPPPLLCMYTVHRHRHYYYYNNNNNNIYYILYDNRPPQLLNTCTYVTVLQYCMHILYSMCAVCVFVHYTTVLYTTRIVQYI